MQLDALLEHSAVLLKFDIHAILSRKINWKMKNALIYKLLLLTTFQ